MHVFTAQARFTFAILPKSEESAGYFSQPCMQPFLLGHKLQFRIEKSFRLGFDGALGIVSIRISAG
jgi:hypothetical protein